jgi:hypothetical protein
MLHNGTCYKTGRVSQRYVLQNASVTKRYVLKKRHELENVTSQNGTSYLTVHLLYCTMNAPNHGLVGRLPDLT